MGVQWSYQIDFRAIVKLNRGTDQFTAVMRDLISKNGGVVFNYSMSVVHITTISCFACSTHVSDTVTELCERCRCPCRT